MEYLTIEYLESLEFNFTRIIYGIGEGGFYKMFMLFGAIDVENKERFLSLVTDKNGDFEKFFVSNNSWGGCSIKVKKDGRSYAKIEDIQQVIDKLDIQKVKENIKKHLQL